MSYSLVLGGRERKRYGCEQRSNERTRTQNLTSESLLATTSAKDRPSRLWRHIIILKSAHGTYKTDRHDRVSTLKGRSTSTPVSHHQYKQT